ncbi:MAG TPA: phosphate ABC transporter, permease protein PstA, partial [Treponemataceae bacterium]|nr:phosphate ABC transporter, permease protein PstA [Treponemataceae bacterium]
MKQKTKDGILYGIMILATGIILATLLWILFYIVSNGIGSINFAFIFSPGNEKGIFAMIVTTAWLVAV